MVEHQESDIEFCNNRKQACQGWGKGFLWPGVLKLGVSGERKLGIAVKCLPEEEFLAVVQGCLMDQRAPTKSSFRLASLGNKWLRGTRRLQCLSFTSTWKVECSWWLK